MNFSQQLQQQSLRQKQKRKASQFLLLRLVIVCLGLLLLSVAVFLSENVRFTAPSGLWDAPPSNPQHQQQHQRVEKSTRDDAKSNIHDNDDDLCIFADSPLRRKVYVYPSPGDDDWKGKILSSYAHNVTRWPWLILDENARNSSSGHYNVLSQMVQYTTELLVREILVNPKSCLRTWDPDAADLFYVPYLPSTEHHVGSERKPDFSTSDYGRAIMELLDNANYEQWEKTFGLTSHYWKKRNGADHILVFSEPMHGLYHPRSKRGNFHFIHSQKQLTPPIVISVELSKTFIDMYPNCAKKNILVPYPNTHGSWFNGEFAKQAQTILEAATTDFENALPAERNLEGNRRPIPQFYAAGNHGTCKKLRKAMQEDYTRCSYSHKALKKFESSRNSEGMRISTFCPAPGGDSPSAKRMFDALFAGCIPIIISEDFVWPFTKEFDSSIALDPAEFSIRLNASDYDSPLLDRSTCKPLDPNRPGLQAFLESISTTELKRLRRGAENAGKLYAWYAERPDLPENPLRERVLPDGGAAHYVVQALAERAKGVRWPACKEELQNLPPNRKEVTQFKC